MVVVVGGEVVVSGGGVVAAGIISVTKQLEIAHCGFEESRSTNSKNASPVKLGAAEKSKSPVFGTISTEPPNPTLAKLKK